MSAIPQPRRVSCGAAGHMRTTYTGTDDFWRLHRSITVTAEQYEMLPRQQSTITSLDELEQLWVEEPSENGLTNDSSNREHALQLLPVRSSETRKIATPRKPFKKPLPSVVLRDMHEHSLVRSTTEPSTRKALKKFRMESIGVKTRVE
ncbi:hypothetical protein JG687_00008208 [Phytophthora cactorum]|uniref:Uncharacterized protein n=1 Tax=Phytophthora cactorum TaxID=29920 RepID=A0A8T1UG75_9STRA|nr:hypothetical protein JG687_00008208 [Phytophthora cactorum]